MNGRNPVPAIRDYRLASLVSLAVLALCLWSEGFEAWSLLPLIPGLLSLVLLSAAGPIFVLLLVGLLYGIGARLGLGGIDSSISGLMIGSCLVYVTCHWRLISLTKQALPSDPRRARAATHSRVKGRWFQRQDPPRRTTSHSQPSEWLILMMQAIGFPVLGFGVLILLATEMSEGVPEGVSRTLWGLLLVAWSLLGLLSIGYALATILRWIHFSQAEAELFLQDELWSGTRSEQRRLYSFVVQQLSQAEKRGELP
ncbi:MAG: hypothetical protein SNJ75_03395 [Gemmataceae bacterium]